MFVLPSCCIEMVSSCQVHASYAGRVTERSNRDAVALIAET